jgi:hypothetical protein
MAPTACELAVIFPDEFPPEAVDTALGDLEASKIGLVVVTAKPRRFDVWLSRDHANHVLLPKPIWTWNIIDSVRAWLLLSNRNGVLPSAR